jgi:hypothetical protein
MKKIWLAGVLGALAMTTAGGASAAISRTSDGKFVVKNTNFHAQDGTFLGSVSTPLSFRYVTAIGRYGGGDTAAGRRTAKARATQKTYNCTAAFFAFGLLGNNGEPWNRNCGRSGYSQIIDPDITLISDWWAYYTIDQVSGFLVCDRARQLAQQFSKTGPVTATGAVDSFNDAAGTEEDWTVGLGTHVTLCY